MYSSRVSDRDIRKWEYIVGRINKANQGEVIYQLLSKVSTDTIVTLNSVLCM